MQSVTSIINAIHARYTIILFYHQKQCTASAIVVERATRDETNNNAKHAVRPE